MKLLHCNSCHHEWEGREGSTCNWCGGSSYVLTSINTQGILNAAQKISADLKKFRRAN